MSDKSSIEWTDATWNVSTGCTKTSPGCARCYIERTPPFRIAGRRFVKGHIPLLFHRDRLALPRAWTKPRRVFVNSLSDLFHPDVPDQFLHEVYHVMEHNPQHQFQVLTKRAVRMRSYLDWRYGDGRIPSRHIWHGVSVENRAMRWRINELRKTRSRVRFVSFEPLLEDVSDGLDLAGIHWAIWGGESGPRARLNCTDWIERGVRQCRAQYVAPFVKQLGANVEGLQECGDCDPCCAGQRCSLAYPIRLSLRDRKGGDIAEFPRYLRVREFPRVEVLV